MAIPAIIAGVLLVVIGIVGYAAQDPAKTSPTALIPAVFGVLLAACGLLAVWKAGLRKHAMHAAAAISLLGLIGAPYPIFKRLLKGAEINPAEPAVVSAYLTSFVCAVFLAMCVRSFSAARRAREAAAANPPAPPAA
jgi:hypothetical protein